MARATATWPRAPPESEGDHKAARHRRLEDDEAGPHRRRRLQLAGVESRQWTAPHDEGRQRSRPPSAAAATRRRATGPRRSSRGRRRHEPRRRRRRGPALSAGRIVGPARPAVRHGEATRSNSTASSAGSRSSSRGPRHRPARRQIGERRRRRWRAPRARGTGTGDVHGGEVCRGDGGGDVFLRLARAGTPMVVGGRRSGHAPRRAALEVSCRDWRADAGGQGLRAAARYNYRAADSRLQ